MNTRSNRQKTVDNLNDKEYRDLYVDSHLRNGLAFQIRGMRNSRGWTQAQLAGKCNSRQTLISRLENPDYGRYTIETLKKLASVFDVALLVRFVPFSELLGRTVLMDEREFNVPSFEDDKLKGGTADSSNVIRVWRSVAPKAAAKQRWTVNTNSEETKAAYNG